MNLNTKNNEIKAFIFDVDGTMINPHEGLIECLKHTVNELNLSKLSDDIFDSFIGPPIQNSFQKYYNLSLDEAKNVRDVFRKFYEKDEYLYKAYVYDGIFEFLDLLKEKNIKIGVATYKREDYALKLLKYFKIDKYCDAICGSDFDNKLTKFDIIKNCLKKLKIENPQNTVMIGDTCFDSMAAKDLNMSFVCCTYGFGFKCQNEIDNSLNIFVANDAKDLVNIFK